jgi:DNA-binding transcriptional ArsR family regulator
LKLFIGKENNMGIIRKDLYSLEQNTMASTFAIFSHPGRLKIVLMLLINDRLSLGQIQEQLELSQAAVSDQVRKLKDVGLLEAREVGTSVFYSLNRDLWESIKELNESFWEQVGGL